MLKVALKNLFAHRLRLALTTFSVVLGVAFVAGTFVLTDTMGSVFDDLVRGGAAEVDVMVRGASVGGNSLEDLDVAAPAFPEAALDDVLAVDGVARAEGAIEGFAMIVRPDGEPITPMGPPTIGGGWTPGEREIREGGREPQGATDVVIDAATANRHDLQVGDEVTVVFSTTEPRPFTVVGISTKEGDNLAGASLAQFEPEVAHEVLGLVGRYTAIFAWVEDGVTPEVLVERLEAALPADLEAITAADWADELMAGIEEALGFFNYLFGIFAFIALFVGAFIISNTFAITVLQRTREFALLRSLGASRRQVVGAVVGEATVLGLLASAIGIVAGLGLARVLYALLSQFGLDMPTGALVLLPRTIVVALVVGLLVTIVSSLLPARRAAGIHPMAAMREASAKPYVPSRARSIAGLVAGAGAVVAVVAAGVGQPDGAVTLVAVGAALAVIGLAASGPSLTRPVLRLLGGSGSRLGTVGRLARGNSMRTPRRTWTTAAALTIGLALVSSVSVMAATMKASANEALEGSIKADAIVSASNAMTGGTVPPVLAGSLADVPEVGAISTVRMGPGQVDGASTFVTAVDPAGWEQVAETAFTEGVLADLATPATVAIDEDLAASLGVSVGETVDAVFPASGATELRVAAIFEPDQLLSGWVVSTATFETLLERTADAAVLVAGADGVEPAAVLAAVERAADAYPAVVVQDQAQYRESVAGQVDRLLALVTALLGMALLIAVLGIMNTLALSIHERTREIGLLRAVGMTQRQVRGMVRWEALTVALLGAFVGVLLGLVFGWATTRALSDQGLSVFVVPYGQLGIAALLAGLAGILAAVGPARKAARLDVLRAVTVE